MRGPVLSRRQSCVMELCVQDPCVRRCPKNNVLINASLSPEQKYLLIGDISKDKHPIFAFISDYHHNTCHILSHF